jgi:phosphate-selective porin
MRYVTLIILSLTHLVGLAQNNDKLPVSWHGYSQIRFASNLNDVNSFAMRRMKLWVNSTPNFNEHWGYKVQATITSFQNEKFFLQDVEAFYQSGNFKINLGQFVPHYSLQRFQHDYTIPLMERSEANNALIPNGTLGVRDIGAEVKYNSSNKSLETWMGIFNGYGIKEYHLENSGILLTHKTVFHIFSQQVATGYSVMYRKADQLPLLSVLPDTVLFSGNDFRYNLFGQFRSKKFQFQAEYLWATLDNKTADGYYFLATLDLGKNQLAASWNQYNDLIESTNDAPVVHFGYNYFFDQDKLKIMFDNGAQINDGRIQNYFPALQFQLFFN